MCLIVCKAENGGSWFKEEEKRVSLNYKTDVKRREDIGEKMILISCEGHIIFFNGAF